MNPLTVAELGKLAFGSFEFIDAITGDRYDYIEATNDPEVANAVVTAIYAISKNFFRVYFEKDSYPSVLI